MKITLYTVAGCKFSEEERTYLKSKNLEFVEKDVEKDHTALDEMLHVGNNFAGTPVTQIVHDDNSAVVLKGFTPEEFDQALVPPAAPGTTPAAPAAAAPNPLDGILQDLQAKIPPPTMDQSPPPAPPGDLTQATTAQPQPPVMNQPMNQQPVADMQMPPMPDMQMPQAPPVVEPPAQTAPPAMPPIMPTTPTDAPPA